MYVYIHTHTYTCAHLYTRVSLQKYACVCACMYTCTNTSISETIKGNVRGCTYACLARNLCRNELVLNGQVTSSVGTGFESRCRTSGSHLG